MMYKRAMLLATLLSTTTAYADENESNGFFVGAGVFGTGDSNCYDCDGYEGAYGEVGYDFNTIVGIEAKIAKGDMSGVDADLSMTYVGVNIGHDFNTGWFRFYGKVGYMTLEESRRYDWPYGYGYYQEDITLKGVAYGIGARFNTSGRPGGFYIKLEGNGVAYTVDYDDDNVEAVVSLGIGYRF